MDPAIQLSVMIIMPLLGVALAAMIAIKIKFATSETEVKSWLWDKIVLVLWMSLVIATLWLLTVLWIFFSVSDNLPVTRHELFWILVSTVCICAVVGLVVIDQTFGRVMHKQASASRKLAELVRLQKKGGS